MADEILKFKKTLNTKLSKNFFSSEFDCHCKYKDCTNTYINKKLIDYLQSKREILGKAINITSGYRCKKHNEKIGGAKESYHMKGFAADINALMVPIKDIADLCSDADGLGVYKSFVHVDVRGFKARWGGK